MGVVMHGLVFIILADVYTVRFVSFMCSTKTLMLLSCESLCK